MNRWMVAGIISVLLAGAAVIHVCSLVRYVGYRQSHRESDPSLASRVNRLETDAALLESRTGMLPSARQRLAGLTETAEKMASIFPDDKTPHDLTSLIRSQAAEAGVVPRWIKIRSMPVAGAAEPGEDDFSALRFSVFMEGGYDQLAGFINRMEQLDQPGVAADGDSVFFEIADMYIAGRMTASDGSESAMDSNIRHPCTLMLYTYRPAGERIYE